MINLCEKSRALAVQCVNCNRLGQCGHGKKYLVRGDGVNCDNFEGRAISVEILKAGNKREKYYNFNCPKCFCLIGAKHSELTWKSDFRNGEYCELKCPSCGKRITGDSKNEAEREDL